MIRFPSPPFLAMPPSLPRLPTMVSAIVRAVIHVNQMLHNLRINPHDTQVFGFLYQCASRRLGQFIPSSYGADAAVLSALTHGLPHGR